MKSRSTRALGCYGESLAAKYLEAKGYRILERNYVSPYGEIDLVAVSHLPGESKRFVFVEVKTRRSRRYGYPEEGITAKKLTHLVLACQDYLQRHQEEEPAWQIDVISVELSSNSPVRITHLENITLY